MSDFKLVKLLNPIVMNLDGPSFTGAYNNLTPYTTGESVSYNGSSYVAIVNTTGNLPTDTTYWQLLAAQGTPGTGIITGGTTNQALTKIDGVDYNTQWSTIDKTFVGLGNVDNTSDVNKPVSTAQATAIGIVQSDIDTHELDLANPHAVTKTQVGLSNVQNLDQTDPNNIVQDSTHRFATDAEKAFWNADFVGENDTVAGTAGNVPAPALYDGIRKKKYLRADGSWSAQTDKHLARSEALTAIGQFTGRVTTANQWFDVAYSPELNLFVAIAASGTNRISISKDGKNWRDIAAPANNVWTKIIWSPNLGIFCAVSFDGASRCMTSPDGVTWTLRSIGAEQWYDITWSNKLNLFCATSLGGGTGIATSPDGITWTSQSASSTTNFYTVTWSPELEIFCTVRLNGAAFTSPDGVTWTSQTIPDKSWSSVCWSPELGIFCAVGVTNTNRCATSVDGITWVTRVIPACSWRSVTWAAELGMFIALCSNGSLAYSFDGTTWVSGTAPEASNQWYSGIWAKEAGVFVITGITGTNRIMTSRYTRGFEKGFNPESKNIVLTRTGTTQTLNKIDAYNTSRFTSATAVTVTVPSDTTAPTVMIGDKFKVIQDGAGVITFAPDTGVTINAVGGVLTTTQYECVELEKTGLNTWSLSKSNTPIPTIPIVDITQDGKLSSVQYEQLSFDMARDISINSYYKKLTYSLGDLTTVEVFTDNTETTLQYTKALTYTLGDLTTVVITRFIDSATATKTLTYTLGNLTSVDYS